VLIVSHCLCGQALVETLSQSYSGNEQLTTTWSQWLNGSEGDVDWRDVLNRTDAIMTMIKQYTEVLLPFVLYLQSCVVCPDNENDDQFSTDQYCTCN